MAIGVFAIITGLFGFGILMLGDKFHIKPLIYVGIFTFGLSFFVAALANFAMLFSLLKKLLSSKKQ